MLPLAGLHNIHPSIWFQRLGEPRASSRAVIGWHVLLVAYAPAIAHQQLTIAFRKQNYNVLLSLVYLEQKPDFKINRILKKWDSDVSRLTS
ncbi:hypothetical protein ElyMa_003529200 [Elysia marginata]|uniref:Uncharacterized protein n=1 Tax=Elysia marginata TaxID=1093978 RepID=A0AAV4EI20_9GAST|nr:hypothetical protein ElyMa_003529200 [Elysia marginata]